MVGQLYLTALFPEARYALEGYNSVFKYSTRKVLSVVLMDLYMVNYV